MIKWLVEKWIDKKNENIKGSTANSKQLASKIIEDYDIKDKCDVDRFVNDKMGYKLDEFAGLKDIQQDLNYTKQRDWKGDCDDFSMVAYRLLEQLGYNPKLLTLVPLKIWISHVVCVFKEDDKIYYISTEGLQGSFNDIQEIKDFKNYIIAAHDIRKVKQ